MRTSDPPGSAIHVVKQQARDLNQRADRVANQKSPTVPQYDLPDNPPATSVEGELAVDVNGKLWWFIDAEWRTC
jgi:hypothetical protein